MNKKKTTKAKPNTKFKKQYFVVFESIFHQKVHVFINYPISAYNNWLKKQGVTNMTPDDYNDNFAAHSSVLKRSGHPDEYIINMANMTTSMYDAATLNHEVVHTIVKIFDKNNIPFNYDTQEFLAWDIGNLFYSIGVKLYSKNVV